MDHEATVQVIDVVTRVGALALTIWFMRSVYYTWRHGYFTLGERRATRSDDPGAYWTILVIWFAMGLASARFAWLGP